MVESHNGPEIMNECIARQAIRLISGACSGIRAVHELGFIRHTLLEFVRLGIGSTWNWFDGNFMLTLDMLDNEGRRMVGKRPPRSVLIESDDRPGHRAIARLFLVAQ